MTPRPTPHTAPTHPDPERLAPGRVYDATLGRLDDAVVPSLQRGARAVAGVLGAPLRGVRRLEDRLLDGRPAAALYRGRWLLLLASALLAFGASAVHLSRFPELRQDRADAAAVAREQDVRGPGATSRPADAAGGAQILGPPVGTPVEGYVERRHDELAALPPDARRVAVVSLEEYGTPDAVTGVLPATATVRFAQLRVPVESFGPFETEVVSGDLAGSVERALSGPLADLAEREREVRELLESGSIRAEEWVRDLELRLEELAAARNVVNSGSGVVFAVVVEARAGALQELARHDAVRLVDVGDGETDPDRSGFFGLLPEDGETVTYGQTR